MESIRKIIDKYTITSDELEKCTKELRDNLEVLLTANRDLARRLNEAQKTAERMTRAAIYFSETYSRLSPEMRAEFDRVGNTTAAEFESLTGGIK